MHFAPDQIRTLLVLAMGIGPMVASVAQTAAPHPCGPVDAAQAGNYGPFDYRKRRDKLELVERFHFTPKVEALIAGQSSYIGDDLSYLMRHFPNHHRGLMSILRFVNKTKNPQPPRMQYSIECYFDRALRFAPDDTVVRVLFANYLGSINQKTQAESHLRKAIEFAGDNPLSHFNIGLALLDLGNFDLALQQAHKARTLGLSRPELEDKLRAAGQWREPSN